MGDEMTKTFEPLVTCVVGYCDCASLFSNKFKTQVMLNGFLILTAN
ncbi:uncharacterized protein G2W53_005340 [Senna tora]|uniref:Uncharacterized protein n=1 Tax=Senna tora TaxID=362788 RepID=A0A834XDK6_9FABA|nr:uncharacterized protein G2W53_005340 [Senna tora]